MPRPPTPPSPSRKPDADPPEIVHALLQAYRQGAFPMADLPNSPRARAQAARAADDTALQLPHARTIDWYSPDPRAILPLTPAGLHIPATLKRLLRTSPFSFTTDTCFERVIRACARPRPSKPGDHENGLWIDESIARLYTLLHTHAHAHSIEAWLDSSLVGGIYGVHIGSAFFAESMFCRPDLGGSNASNLCLVHLVAHLRAKEFTLLDVQIANPHTQRFGVINVPRAEYLARLALATNSPADWHGFDPRLSPRVLGMIHEP